MAQTLNGRYAQRLLLGFSMMTVTYLVVGFLMNCLYRGMEGRQAIETVIVNIPVYLVGSVIGFAVAGAVLYPKFKRKQRHIRHGAS